MQKQLLLGVEAIAQGAIDSGISGVYAYPGTPSTESPNIFRILKRLSPVMYTRAWAANEKRPWNRLWECLTPAKSLGMYETRRYECGSRLLHECSYYRS